MNERNVYFSKHRALLSKHQKGIKKERSEKIRNRSVSLNVLLKYWILLCLIKLLAVGCWLLAVGCWLLAVGCWLLADFAKLRLVVKRNIIIIKHIFVIIMTFSFSLFIFICLCSSCKIAVYYIRKNFLKSRLRIRYNLTVKRK